MGKWGELGNQILCFLMICYETLTESILSREQKGSTFFRTLTCLLLDSGHLFNYYMTFTMNDVDILASHINSLTKFSNNMVNTLHQHAAHISSFMKVMDQRTTNLMRGIQTNYQTNKPF